MIFYNFILLLFINYFYSKIFNIFSNIFKNHYYTSKIFNRCYLNLKNNLKNNLNNNKLIDFLVIYHFFDFIRHLFILILLIPYLIVNNNITNILQIIGTNLELGFSIWDLMIRKSFYNFPNDKNDYIIIFHHLYSICVVWLNNYFFYNQIKYYYITFFSLTLFIGLITIPVNLYKYQILENDIDSLRNYNKLISSVFYFEFIYRFLILLLLFINLSIIKTNNKYIIPKNVIFFNYLGYILYFISSIYFVKTTYNNKIKNYKKLKNTLAIEGGYSICKKKNFKKWPIIPYFSSMINLSKVIKSGILGSSSSNTSYMMCKFEKEFSKYIGVKHSLMTCSGTAALEIALKSIEIKSGDEILVPAFTWISSVSCILSCGAIPKFIDIDIKTGNIDLELLKKSINNKIKAIIIVHLHGTPINIDLLRSIIPKNIHVIQDAAQAHGAMWKNNMIGSIHCGGYLNRCVTIFSVQQSKNIPAGEGGIFVTNDDTLALKAAAIRSSGIKSDGLVHYLGSMYRGNELSAAIAINQLYLLEKRIINANKNFLKLLDTVSNLKGFYIVGFDNINDLINIRPALHKIRLRFQLDELFTDKNIISSIEFRNRLMKVLSYEGIPVTLWQELPIPCNPLFNESLEKYSNSTYLLENSFCLCSQEKPFIAQNEKNILFLCNALKKVWINKKNIINLK